MGLPAGSVRAACSSWGGRRGAVPAAQAGHCWLSSGDAPGCVPTLPRHPSPLCRAQLGNLRMRPQPQPGGRGRAARVWLQAGEGKY